MMGQFLKSVLFCILLSLPFWLVLRLAWHNRRRKKGQKISPAREVLMLLFFVYIVSVLALTLVPLPISLHRSGPQKNINFIPFVNSYHNLIRYSKYDLQRLKTLWIENFAGNLALFFPLGLFVPLLFPSFRTLKKMIAVAALSSLAIETAQLVWQHFGNQRTFDIDDVLLNTLSACLGYGLYKIIFGKRKKRLEKKLDAAA